jgi:hypothetical protein
MSILVCCPNCAVEFPLLAGFVDGDGKHLALLMGDLEPVTARALMDYLKLWKPRKTRLTNARAVRLSKDVTVMIRSGACERNGQTTNTTEADWQTAMHQMAANPPSKLPLTSHGYLLEVVTSTATDRAQRESEADRNQLDREQRDREEKLRRGERGVLPSGISPVREMSDEERAQHEANRINFFQQLEALKREKQL